MRTVFDFWRGEHVADFGPDECPLCGFIGPDCVCGPPPATVYAKLPRETERMPSDHPHTLASNTKERPATPSRELAGRPRGGASPRISNFKLIHPENGHGPSIKAPLTTQEIVEGIQAATDGWPKVCDGSLFVPSRAAGVRWLRTGNDLHAWASEIAGESGRVIEWGRGSDLLTMNAAHSSMLELCDRFESVEVFPHHPPHAASYYLLPAQMPEPGSGAFDDLLAMFEPDTDADRDLIRAFFLTLVWGGPGGKRPIFGFEAATENGKAGQGSGKSTVPQKAGELLGGFVSIDLATDSGKDLMPRLLSAAGRRARLVIFDNVKGSRVSSSLIESSVTAPVLSGKQLFQGEGSRPNFLTWCITSNQPSLSKDLAARTYPIRVRPPKYSPEWEARINAFIASHRWSIIADMLAELAGPPVTTKPQPWSRWAAWESDVLLRVCDLDSINPTVAGRRADLDDDDTTAAAVRDALAKWINSEKIIDPESFRLRMPAEAVAKAVANVSPHGTNVVSTCRWLASINVPGIQRKKSGSSRFWLWTGSKTTDDDDTQEWESIPVLPP